MSVLKDDPPAPPEPATGTILDGRYRLEERIGWGGMGEIYRGRHLMMAQEVAIKLLHPDLVRDPLAAKRFAREARSTFRFDHPNCVRVTDFGATPAGVLYLVMEYLRGRTASQELAVDGPLAARRVVHIARQVCDALGHAHGLGFVHRDLKPANIMLLHRDGDADFVKVLDFGLAKLLDPDASGMTVMSLSPLTRAGMVFGTAEYVSPEQASGQPLSPATDIYSLGVTLYELLTGQLPFTGATFTEVLSKQVRDTPVPPGARRPDLDIPPALDALVMGCLAKQPEARPRSTSALSRRLDAIAPDLDRDPMPAAVAASETVDLSAMDLGATALPARDRDTDPGPPVPAKTAGTRRRIPVVIPVALLFGAAALAGALVLAGRRSPPDVPVTRGLSTTAPKAAPALAAALPDAAPAIEPAPAVSAPPAAAAPARQRERGPDAARPARAQQPRMQRHLRAAEAARRQGNRLKQLAEADSALRIAPDSDRAAFLLGDALVHSGDKPNGCKYLHRARRLGRARAAYRRAGCSGD